MAARRARRLLLEGCRLVYGEVGFQHRLLMATARCGGDRLAYFEEVRAAAAVVQKPIFAAFGLPAPPGGVAALRRLTMRFEKEGDPAVLSLGLQCRLLLGVEGGIAITDTMDVPFFQQPERGACVQTCVMMALKWCFPERAYTFERLDALTGRAAEATLFSDFDFSGLRAGGAAFLRRHFADAEVAELVVERTDLDAGPRATEVHRPRPRGGLPARPSVAVAGGLGHAAGPLRARWLKVAQPSPRGVDGHRPSPRAAARPVGHGGLDRQRQPLLRGMERRRR